MTALSVAFDGRALGDASAFRGLGIYLRLLLTGLAGWPESADPAGGAGAESHGLDGIRVTALVRAGVELPAGVRRVVVARRAPTRWANIEHHLRLPRELSRIGADVVHSPALDPPRRVDRPWVQTVADVLPLADLHPAYAVERDRWRRWAGRIRRADAVVTFSRHSADQITEHLGVDPERIHRVPLAPDPRYRPAALTTSASPPSLAPAAPGSPEPLGGSDPYFLYVGEYGPHKGFREAAAVMAELIQRGLPHRLLMAGRVAPPRRSEVEAELSAVGPEARRRIEVLGWVPDLLPLYRGATALMMTTRHEGFGLPAVEAMATATPLVAFSNSALPEVIGDGGVLVPDGDIQAMADSLYVLAHDPHRRQAAAVAALDRSAAFDPAEMTRSHVGIYRAVAGRSAAGRPAAGR